MNDVSSETNRTAQKDTSARTFVRTDWIVCAILALAASFAIWSLARSVPEVILKGEKLPDIYFSADCGRVHANMVTRLESDHFRTSVHPLFSITMYPVYHSVAFLTGNDVGSIENTADAVSTGHIMSALAAAIAMGLFFLLLRCLGTRLPDAVILCVFAASSAFAIFWFSVPETYPWGAITILGALLVSAIGSRRKLHYVWYGIASLGTFAMTTTNWSVGLLATWTRFSIKKAFMITFFVLAVGSVLSISQKLLFPSSWFFFNIKHETSYVMQDYSGGPASCLKSALFHGITMPKITMVPHARYEGKVMMRTQGSSPGSATPYGRVAVVLWIIVFSAGLVAFARDPRYLPFKLTLGAALIGQFVLHAIYGAETFLYSAHYGPLMIVPIAYLTRTRLRVPTLVIVSVLSILLFVNNSRQFEFMRQQVASAGTTASAISE